ncbi:hypothetical protein DRN73_09705 [Candidatus Pacearchaeota archaeon]|nr:MAG: hypothetical protein DRN73_09705 [Candidatus Pacearchaeota archaeon]
MNKKQRILKTLKNFGRLPSTRLANICQLNYLTFNKEADKLCKEGFIIQFKETVATYWQISKKGLKEVDKE